MEIFIRASSSSLDGATANFDNLPKRLEMTLEPSGITDAGIKDSFSVIFDRTLFIISVGSDAEAASPASIGVATASEAAAAAVTVFDSPKSIHTASLSHKENDKCTTKSL